LDLRPTGPDPGLWGIVVSEGWSVVIAAEAIVRFTVAVAVAAAITAIVAAAVESAARVAPVTI
jgi:hypothetical protein